MDLKPFVDPISSESARAYLLLLDPGIVDSKQIGKRILIPERGLFIGTDPLSDIPLLGILGEAPCHVRIWREPGEHWQFRRLEENGSIFINQIPHERGVLKDGDLLQVGRSTFEFLLEMGLRYRAYLEMDSRVRLDQLTKIQNRKSMMEHIEREMSRLSRNQTDIFSLVLFNLDHFAETNATYGYYAGDEVLRAVSRRLEQSLRKHELVGRYSGEEFLILLPGVSQRQVGSLAEILRARVQNQPVFWNGHTIPVTLSGGAITATETMSFQGLLQVLEDRLLMAKETGRNRMIIQ